MAETIERNRAPPAPRENPLLLGHEAAERRFLDAWNSGRLPHGWMITGPRGIGKASFAFRIARFVLSGGAGADGLFGPQQPESLELAADHPVFRRVASGGHADLMTLERTVDPKKRDNRGPVNKEDEEKKKRSVIVVDDVRAAGNFLSLTPAEGGWRVLVVDCADELNDSAANALLKMLEEPPERALILLVSHAPGRLPATIRSRCCRMALRPLAEETVHELLARYRPALAPEDAALLVRLAEGSIGRALRLGEDGGLDLYRDLDRLLAGLPDLDSAAAHGLGDRLGRRGAEEAFGTAVELLGCRVAGHIRTLAGGQAPGAAGLDRWMEVWDKTSRLTAQTDALNLDRKQVMLNLFVALQRAARP